MLFHIGFIFLAAFFLLSGYLMFANPDTYVKVTQWYLDKIGFGLTIPKEKYSRWSYRLSGLVLLGMSLLFFWQYFKVVGLIH